MNGKHTQQYAEGYKAREDGVEAYRNPYLPIPGKEKSAYEWRMGWTAADGHIYCKKHGITNRLIKSASLSRNIGALQKKKGIKKAPFCDPTQKGANQGVGS